MHFINALLSMGTKRLKFRLSVAFNMQVLEGRLKSLVLCKASCRSCLLLALGSQYILTIFLVWLREMRETISYLQLPW